MVDEFITTLHKLIKTNTLKIFPKTLLNTNIFQIKSKHFPIESKSFPKI